MFIHPFQIVLKVVPVIGEALAEYIRMNQDGLKDAVVLMMDGGRVKVDISGYQNDMTTFHNRDDVLALLIHLGYLGYDSDLKEVFIPKYNARFALPIDNNKNHFISPQKDFNYNIELAIWDEHKIYHNSYLKYNKHYHIILDNNEKAYIETSKKVKVYKFLDGTEHILYNDKFYDLKTIKEYKIQITKPVALSVKTQEEINKSKAHKPTNSPWSKGLPKLPNEKSWTYSYYYGG